ncbi:hypothetical protein FRC05_001665, partial [Tulasnella sp. 425]
TPRRLYKTTLRTSTGPSTNRLSVQSSTRTTLTTLGFLTINVQPLIITNTSENRRPSMPLDPDPSLLNNQYYPSSRGLTSRNDYDRYEPSRTSSALLHTIEIDWSQAYRPSTVVEDIPSRDFSGLEMQWATIFDARRHRKPALPASWFEDDWEVAGVYPNHVLFIHRAEKKRAVMVYNISETRISFIEVKYESAGSSYDGRFLLVTRERFLYVHLVETSKVIKKIPSQENPNSQMDVQQPRFLLGRQRRKVLVMVVWALGGARASVHAPRKSTEILVDAANDAGWRMIALEMRGLDRNSPLQRYGRSPISVAPSMKLLPELFADPLSDLIIAGVSTASAENSLTLIFDPLTGKYVGNKKLNLNAGDRVYCGACRLRMEQNANVFRRLMIHPEGLLRPDSAGTG